MVRTDDLALPHGADFALPHGADFALPHGADPRALSRSLSRAHDAFVADGRFDASLRPVVAESWLRSISSGLDPEAARAAIRLQDDDLAAVRDAHPLAAAMPVIRRLLVDEATDSGLLVAVSDAAGRLLWVEGSSRLRSSAEAMHFMPGADWSEGSAGTNAPGTALALDRPVQILGAEHLAREVTPWSCSAAPIHDPDTGAVLGVLDVTGGVEVATPQSLTLVRATVAAVEAELRLARLDVHRSAVVEVSGWQGTPRLDVLGRHGAELRCGASSARLSLRHSELLVLLSESGDGYTGAELALALSDDHQSGVTVRAELSRLRGVLSSSSWGPIGLGSRPYRLLGPIATDLDRLRDDLAAGRLRRAVAEYRGPVLPASTAPGVEQLRDTVHRAVRSALLAGHDVDAVLSFADTDHGRDDLPMWEHALGLLPAGSPRHGDVLDHVARLDDELA